jgi:hypothetical protein
MSLQLHRGITPAQAAPRQFAEPNSTPPSCTFSHRHGFIRFFGSMPPSASGRTTCFRLKVANRFIAPLPPPPSRFLVCHLSAKACSLTTICFQVVVDSKTAAMEGQIHDIAWAPQTGAVRCLYYNPKPVTLQADRDVCFIAAGKKIAHYYFFTTQNLF